MHILQPPTATRSVTFPFVRLSLGVFRVFLFPVGEEDLFACFDEGFSKGGRRLVFVQLRKVEEEEGGEGRAIRSRICAEMSLPKIFSSGHSSSSMPMPILDAHAGP
jgi:hypothetical protein